MASLAEAKGAARIPFKTGVGHKTPPYGRETYADPKNHKYPLTKDGKPDPGRISAAMHYSSEEKNRVAGRYSVAEWATIRRRIAAAANRQFGAGHTAGTSGNFVKGKSSDEHAKAAISAARKAR